MFTTGTRVIVLDSSFKGNTGPKRGSVGYVLDMKAGQYGSYFDEKNWWFPTLHRICFVRYGFESKKRVESKFFISLFPYVTRSHVRDDYDEEKLIEKRLGTVFGFDPTGKEVYDKIRYSVTSEFGKKHVHTGVIAPLPSRDWNLITKDPCEFAAWVDCFMKSPSFRTLLDRMIQNIDKMSNIFLMEQLQTLRHMLNNKAERTHFLRMAQKKQSAREGLVELIRKIHIVGTRGKFQKAYRQHIKYIEDHYLSKTVSGELKAIRMVMLRLYDRIGAEYLREIRAVNNCTEINRKVDYMVEITNRLVSLARILDRKGEEKAKIAKI